MRFKSRVIFNIPWSSAWAALPDVRSPRCWNTAGTQQRPAGSHGGHKIIRRRRWFKWVKVLTSFYKLRSRTYGPKICRFIWHVLVQIRLFLVIFCCGAIPGDISLVSDRCRHSAACQAGPAVDLSTPSHSQEGFWTHIHVSVSSWDLDRHLWS